MNLIKQKPRTLIITSLIALLTGLCIAWFSYPVIEREINLNKLFSPDSTQRAAAHDYLINNIITYKQNTTIDTRSINDLNLINRITSKIINVTQQDIFLDAVSVIQETGYWKPEYVPLTIWCRRIEIMLNENDLYTTNETALTAIKYLRQLPTTDTSQNNQQIIKLWSTLITWKINDDNENDQYVNIRLNSLENATQWFNNQNAQPLIAKALADPCPKIQRLAWLILAALNPSTGYSFQWDDTTPPEVIEAALWAATVTNPDQCQPLINALNESPWPTATLTYLLSRSYDPEAIQILTLMYIEDGNPSALIPLAESEISDTSVLAKLPVSITAWLGLTSATTNDPEQNPIFNHWYAWHNPTQYANQLNNLTTQLLFDPPVAEDGSVWASVLLAERIYEHNPDIASALARSWLSNQDNDPDIQRAGALLSGLLKTNLDLMQQINLSTRSIPGKRAMRLGIMLHQNKDNILHDKDTPDPQYTIAWRMITDKNNPTGSDTDIILALLAAGDTTAIDYILNKNKNKISKSISPTQYLMQNAWLIERFLPDIYKTVVPLSPWNDAVAALQLDAMYATYLVHSQNCKYNPDQHIYTFDNITYISPATSRFNEP